MSDDTPAPSAPRLFEAPDDLDAINRLYRERRWSDGLPIVPPTQERVDAHAGADAPRAATKSIARVAPGFGAATVERIAINAVLAGCDPEYLPLLIAATEAVARPGFNLQGIQATTNPVAVWLVVNGPVAQRLQRQRHVQLHRAGRLGQCDARPRAAPDPAEHRRRAAG